MWVKKTKKKGKMNRWLESKGFFHRYLVGCKYRPVFINIGQGLSVRGDNRRIHISLVLTFNCGIGRDVGSLPAGLCPM